MEARMVFALTPMGRISGRISGSHGPLGCIFAGAAKGKCTQLSGPWDNGKPGYRHTGTTVNRYTGISPAYRAYCHYRISTKRGPRTVILRRHGDLGHGKGSNAMIP